jgi:hypothetical protein
MTKHCHKMQHAFYVQGFEIITKMIKLSLLGHDYKMTERFILSISNKIIFEFSHFNT